MLNKDLLYKSATPMKLILVYSLVQKIKPPIKNRRRKLFIINYKIIHSGLAIHTRQKLRIVFCSLHVFQQRINRFFRIHIGHMLTQNPHALEGIFIQQQIITPGR